MRQGGQIPTRLIQVVAAALACALGGCWRHRAIQPSRALTVSARDSVARCVPQYPGLLNAAAKLPLLPEPRGVGNLVLIGYVADSGTGRGLSGARVLLRPATQQALARWHDTVYTDAAAGFVFSSVKPGSYEYIAQAMNFGAGRGSIDISSKAETLRVRLRRVGLCGVTLGHS